MSTIDIQNQPSGQTGDTRDALIFIPDISGFTKFVSEIEITHSRHIIARLLEVILKANQLDLEVSEIEGDAVLFFKSGRAPLASDIARQAGIMFLQFHHQLRQMDREKDCDCGACGSMGGLTLKFVAHFGRVNTIRVGGFKKLLGSDVIIAHRLLKNSVEGREYLLMSESLLQSQEAETSPTFPGWTAKLHFGSAQYEHLGTIRYRYVSLSPLLADVPPV